VIDSAEDSLRNIARDCAQPNLPGNCANLVGNGELYGDCISTCVENRVEGLSSECAGCYGDAERCSHDSFCISRCRLNTCSTPCLECLNGADCILELEECSGIPDDTCDEP